MTQGSPDQQPDPLPPLDHFDEREDLAVHVAKMVGCRLNERPQEWVVADAVARIEFRKNVRTSRWEALIDAPGLARRTLALHEVFAAETTKKLATCEGPEARRWKLRLLCEVGLKSPRPVGLAALPATAPSNAVAVWRELGKLLAIRQIEEPPGGAFPLSAPWFAGWSGLAAGEIESGKRWLRANGYLVFHDEGPPVRFGNFTIYWRAAGDGEQAAAVAP